MNKHSEFNKFERKQIQNTPADFRRNLEIFEALYREAVMLKILPLKNPLEGIDVDITLAWKLNRVRGTD